MGKAGFYLGESLKPPLRGNFGGGFPKVVCEPNGDAGSEGQGCATMNADSGIETQIPARTKDFIRNVAQL